MADALSRAAIEEGPDMSRQAIEVMVRDAGIRALHWWLDMGDCLFCTLDNNDGLHEDFCPLFGLDEEDARVQVSDLRESKE
jgi:hypothetical protein